ncbi:MAG: hypothetical protein EPN93_07655 [Spirochaetes bacterium]|nr:MAG: hypothetical protein EPN93_07655 [Spirochaetota bacterium]
MSRLKNIFLGVSACVIFFGVIVYVSIPSIPGMFRLNKQLQEEGYYMAEFEFKMLGLAYYIDKGEYIKALTCMRNLHSQLTTREGLIKVPKFSDKKQELEFYLNLQNPRTGAFMDDSYPYCTYTGPTGNVLMHLSALAQETGQRLRLYYPLKYLDEINTPEKMNAYLDEVSTVGWIASKFPQTTFHNARDLLSLYHEDDTVEKYNLYNLSPESKQAMLGWFYKNQDPETGLWGPKSKSGTLVKMDLSNTASILKAFVDNDGNNINASYPLRYKNELFNTILKELVKSIPGDNEFEEWHEWNLKTPKALRVVTRYLWNTASPENKIAAERLIKNFIRIKFEKYYIPGEGAFSFYPGSQHATLDGTGGGLSDLRDIGTFSAEKLRNLWGGPELTCTDLGNSDIATLTEKEFDSIRNYKNINSLRFYLVAPDAGNHTANAIAVFYPKATPELDIMELVPKAKNWIDATSQSMGNWTSREGVVSLLADIKITPVPVSRIEIPLEALNEALRKNKALTIVGFDTLQVPRCKISFHLSPNRE